MRLTTSPLALLPALLPALLLALAPPSAAQQPKPPQQKPPQQTRNVDQRYPLAQGAALRIYGSFASVKVVGWERDSVVVTGTVAAGDQFFTGGTESGRKFGLESAAGASGTGADPRSARLEFRVPSRARVWVKTGSADVEVSGVAGGLDLNIVGGSIRVTGSPRELTAEAMDGDIDVSGTVPWLRAKTAGGAIRATVRGEDIGLSSVSGRLTLTEGKPDAKASPGGGAAPRPFQRVRLETVTGDITFSGAVDAGGRLDADSHSGAIEVALPADQSADFALTNITGDIRTDFKRAQPGGGAELRSRELVFTTRGGGADISVRNFKGPVVVKKQ
ncbi:MAG TPA: hypothetical protein VKA84_01375 [Gemmatimonadaceae bacterium]|nr:hypothetical protein [Gemmatimonadaceae bacterium]